MTCLGPPDGNIAMLTYKPDHPMRSWASGDRFSPDPAAPAFDRIPPLPVHAEVKRGYAGTMLEFWDDPVPLMTKRLREALVAAGVSNLDVYDAEIVDQNTGKVFNDYVAFNIIGTVAAADLTKTQFDSEIPDRMISAPINSLSISDNAASDELLFRLAESVNAIIVHDHVKTAIESAGVDTLTFIEPENWAG
jgi:hypothetical protein